ncbi:MAG: hypothetical protein A3F73_10635 [Gallionellales bacterium RIFCSPLOWO2_12_FULL_59_22]|nr:MAG: hypothetical protein A2Z65_01405 [Gallionellales bacterium RIFCSPLOWO2_02_58_13]OGT14406.1 MAG: hypothetical protein A3F73_10635 [Gallionellales bacterium RIFCSPLOWO2_12_FULL_59_22]
MTGAGLNQKSWMTIGWALAYLALAGVIGLELGWGRQIRPPLPVPKPLSAALVEYAVQPEFTLPPLEQEFAETTARPIFTPTRRKPPTPVQAISVMQKGQFALLGALITRDKSIALLRDIAAGKAIRVEQGKEIRGITVSKVLPEKVVLTQGDETEELTLKIQPSGKTPVAPKVPVAPQAQAAPAQASQPQAAPPPPAQNIPPAELGRALINERRAVHGLPPI